MKKIDQTHQRGCLHTDTAKQLRPDLANQGSSNLHYLYGLGRIN